MSTPYYFPVKRGQTELDLTDVKSDGPVALKNTQVTIERDKNRAFTERGLEILSWGDIDIKNPDQVRDRITKFFNDCIDRSIKPTVSALALDWRKYWEEVRRALASFTRFRFHVSGEILNRAYFDEMAGAAADFPGCEILDFTKKYDTVNGWLDDNGGTLPGRLHVLFSGLEGVPMNNPYNLPVTRVIMTGTDPESIPENWQICPGHCEECAARGVHCWDSQPGQVIAFWQH